MSAGGAFGGNSGDRPVPPEKGMLPLDHKHLCDLEREEFIACLNVYGFKTETCRPLSRKYFECRKKKNLMAKQDLVELGFRKEAKLEACLEPNIKGILEI